MSCEVILRKSEWKEELPKKFQIFFFFAKNYHDSNNQYIKSDSFDFEKKSTDGQPTISDLSL